ncbi:MAG: hypothetical protein J5943_08415 [Oribacterium sp.]|nr:hypothetical protein [Oribacterium sp.]MBO6308633.1 hypothetical protein [Oribacterium sp.]MBR1857011.1 hypothetical protein [Oribacterium sp.]
MKTSKTMLAVVMSGVIAASMAVPAFASSSHVHSLNPYSGSALAANDANAKREAYWNAFVQANGGKDAVYAALTAADGIKLAPNTHASRVANSQAAAAQANATVELAKEALAGSQVVLAPVLSSADAAALANAAYEATH